MGNAQSQVGRRERLGRHEIEVVKYLGEGGSSFIFLVKDVASPSGKLMVLKRLVAENDSAFELIDSEIRMHKRFRNKNMVEFFDSHVVNKRGSEKEVFILMEYCPSGHLYDNMKKMGDKRFTEKDLLKLFHQLCMYVIIYLYTNVD
jgi:serine/threonine protein kinase